MANELIYPIQSDDDLFTNNNGVYSYNSVTVGYNGSNFIEAAIRFPNVALNRNQSIYSADLRFYCYKYGSEQVKVKCYGIDEDNTQSFFYDPIPTSRPRTTAYNTHYTEWGNGEWHYFSIGIKSIVEEIIGRSGWNSGNALGVYLCDNGTTTSSGEQKIFGGYYFENYWRTYLEVRLEAEPNFHPTPKTVAAPTFPTAKDFGIKMVNPDLEVGGVRVNVLDANEDQLYFTTRKKVLKIIDEGELTTDAVPFVINHNLGYKPAALVYAETQSGKRVKLNRVFDPNYVDPIGGVKGWFGTTNTALKITAGTGIKVYRYIFIDELE